MGTKKKYLDWLFILPTDSLGGGAEQLQFNLVQHLISTRKTCHVIIITQKKRHTWAKLESDFLNITYIPVKNWYLGYLLLPCYILKLKFRYRIKKIFTSQTLINGLVGFLKKIRFIERNTTIITRESNTIYKLISGKKLKLYDLAYKLGYPHVNLIICQTDYMKKELIKSISKVLEHKNVITIPNPINIEENNQRSEEFKPETDKYIIAAGRLVHVKGFDVLIDAFKMIEQEIPDHKLIILGEGYLRNDLQEQINNYNLQDRIILHGFVNNVYPYFKNASLCVLSSRIEGFPNVLLQMMSQNERIVSTLSAGDIKDIEGIYTCETESKDLLAHNILNCLKDGSDHKRTLFDTYLSKRTVDSFIAEVESQISKPLRQ
ncbi:glycosyltransferase [Zhouia spongiae]|uniref:Glycosyltransferase n=1 Tax=Zhouia spongiae TaxID=2202721 RepID=A0ABY3YL70_9FLAO|nr:glycosyltransferase [Zhouia spongiae]UNY98396.1 glycosyltransferase [Zhouia spongiae]